MSNTTTAPTSSSVISGNPYAPQEPSNLIFLEKASFVGNALSEIIYGMAIIVFFRCLYTLIHPRFRKNGREKINYIFVTFVCVLFALNTVFIALNTHLQQSGYIDNRNFPGGPLAFELAQYSKAIVIAPNACFIIANWLADALLMYRCFVIYRRDIWVLVLPMLMYLASIAMGVITLYKSSRPNSNLFSGVTVNFGLPYFTISCANNILLTLIISARLLYHRRKLQQTLGSTGTTNSPYFSIVAMLVESSALYAVFSILFIGPYAANNYASDIFLPILSQTQVIAPMLIIMRVAEQRAWTSNTAAQLQSTTRMDFKSNVRLSTIITTSHDTGSNTLDVPFSINTDKGTSSFQSSSLDESTKGALNWNAV